MLEAKEKTPEQPRCDIGSESAKQVGEKKWVLVRSTQGTLYVLRYEYWREVREKVKMHPAYTEAEMLMTSDDRDELVRFQRLSEEE